MALLQGRGGSGRSESCMHRWGVCVARGRPGLCPQRAGGLQIRQAPGGGAGPVHSALQSGLTHRPQMITWPVPPGDEAHKELEMSALTRDAEFSLGVWGET